MSDLLVAFANSAPGVTLSRVSELVAFLEEKLSTEDAETAQGLLLAAVVPEVSARLHREAEQPPGDGGEPQFPADPEIGDRYTAPNGQIWEWDGDEWVLAENGLTQAAQPQQAQHTRRARRHRTE